MDVADQIQVIAGGFPAAMHDAVAAACDVLPNADHASLGSNEVFLGGESLCIPYRVYMEEPTEQDLTRIDGNLGHQILHCIYSRHHDGFVRQRHVEAIVGLPHPWVVPYVVQLIGEYVIEILFTIQEGLGDLTPDDPRRPKYDEVVENNPSYLKLTAQRVASYWNCYYRSRYPDTNRVTPNKHNYPGFQLLELLLSTSDEAG